MLAVVMTGVLGCAAGAGSPVVAPKAISQESSPLVVPSQTPVAASSGDDSSMAYSSHELDRYRALLNDPDEGIQIAAADALSKRGDLSGKPILLAALQHKDPHHRIDAALALQSIADVETADALRQAKGKERHPLARPVMKNALKRVLKDLRDKDRVR